MKNVERKKQNRRKIEKPEKNKVEDIRSSYKKKPSGKGNYIFYIDLSFSVPIFLPPYLTPL